MNRITLSSSNQSSFLYIFINIVHADDDHDDDDHDHNDIADT